MWSYQIILFLQLRLTNKNLLPEVHAYRLHRFEAGLHGAASKSIDNKSKFQVTWKILKQAAQYKPASN